MSELAPDFPLDDATLIMLAAACEINPDTERTHLQDFLHMGAAEKCRLPECYCGKTDFCETPEDCHIDADEPSDGAVFFVEYQEGQAPYSEHHVIRALVAEVQRLRRGEPA